MPRRFFYRLLSAATLTGDHVSDAELLQRFYRDRDSASFELILRRHADSVWTACRRILPAKADAEDAFQATFLVLLKKAGSIRGSCVGGWLHRVAVNAALKLKANRDRQRDLEIPDRHASPESAAERAELSATLHEELARLPERYRLPVVLCDLEGHSHAAAAAVLDWPIGSVSGRLSRAHSLLRDRLTRRGVAAPAIVLPLVGLPSALVRDATAAAIGTVPVSPSVSILVQGVLFAMRTAKLKLTAMVVASVGLVALAGVGTISAWPRTGAPVVVLPKLDLPLEVAAPVPTEPPIEGAWIPKKKGDVVPTAFPDLNHPDPRKGLIVACPRLFGENALSIEPTDDTYRRLLKARLHQGALEFSLFRVRLDIGAFTGQEYLGMTRVLDDMRAVTLELWANEPKNLVPRLEEFVILAKDFERIATVRGAIGTDPPQVLCMTRRHRLEVEAALWKATHPKPAGK